MPGDLTLSPITAPVLSRMPLVATVTTVSAFKDDASYYLHFEISTNQTLLAFQGSIEQKKQPDSSDQANFVFSSILNNLVGYQLPAFNQDTLALDIEALRKVFIRYEEKYENVGPQSNSYDDSINVLNAGLGHKNLNFSFQDAFVVPPVNGFLRFLSFTGRGQKVKEDTHLYLSLYMQYTDTFHIDVKVRLNYTDATSAEFDLYELDHTDAGGTADLEDNNIVVIPCGYLQAGIDLVATKTVSSYEIFVADNATQNRISEYFLFNLDSSRVTKSFLFFNSAGGWSTLLCRGETEQSFMKDTEEYEVALPDAPVPSDVQYRNLQVKGKEKLRSSAGYFGEKERLHFLEFMNSQAVFEVGASDYLPIRFTKIELPQKNTFPSLLPAVFEYEYAFDSDGFNEEVVW